MIDIEEQNKDIEIFNYLKFIKENPHRKCKADGSDSMYHWCRYYEMICTSIRRYGYKKEQSSYILYNGKYTKQDKQRVKRIALQLLKEWENHGIYKY